MSKKKKDTFADPNDLPQSEVFSRKEVFQHPQPADSGKPLRRPDQKHTKDKNTSKEAGLNEERSPGNAGAFEGFENQEQG